LLDWLPSFFSKGNHFPSVFPDSALQVWAQPLIFPHTSPMIYVPITHHPRKLYNISPKQLKLRNISPRTRASFYSSKTRDQPFPLPPITQEHPKNQPRFHTYICMHVLVTPSRGPVS
jgi:hypothetical protein